MDTIILKLTVNGHGYTLTVKENITLLELLRHHLNLTGAKKGCASGDCGACTVIVNNEATRSCRIPARTLHNAIITTIEGVANVDGSLHPLQQAFIDAGAVQCGFCTPGMILAALALLRKNPSPSPKKIIEALDGNLCRCTGYQPIIEAITSVANSTLKTTSDLTNTQTVPTHSIGSGINTPRIDGHDKVTGKALYTEDINVEGPVLHGAICWTPIPSGRLVSLNLENALAVPGVKRIITAKDIPGQNSLGRWKQDRPVLVESKIRYIGDPLALVLADTPNHARIGAQRIHAEIVPSPPVFTLEDSLNPDSPKLHGNTNTAAEIILRKIPEHPADLNLEFSDTFETNFVEHALLEPENALAYYDNHQLTVIAPSQNVYFDRLEIMRILGFSPRDIHKIRFIEPNTGGAFGKREDMSVQPLAALGTFLTGKTVRIVLNRRESFRTTTKRHPMKISHITHIDDQNHIQKQKIHIIADTGAYSSWAPNILRKSAVHASGPYNIPDIQLHGLSQYTNNAFSGAFRGFGAIQTLFAIERHIDRIARIRNIDPIDFRSLNGMTPGDSTATGQIIDHFTPISELLTTAGNAINWTHPARGRLMDSKWATGFGVAAGFYGIGYGNGIADKGQVQLTLTPEQTLTIATSAIDYGQGAQTVFAQLAAEILDIPCHQITVITGDTQTTPDSGSTVASRQTLVTGNAVVKAAKKLKMMRNAKRSLNTQPLTVKTRFMLPSQTINPESGQGDVYNTYATAAAAVKLQINRKSGQVVLQHIASVHDSGTIINPVLARSQVTGGVMMAAGMALWEQFSITDGRAQTCDFSDYTIPRIGQTPKIDVVFLPTPDPIGPFGARGLGEPAMIAAGPAILNAVCDALDYDFNSVPVTPDMILNALKQL